MAREIKMDNCRQWSDSSGLLGVFKLRKVLNCAKYATLSDEIMNC